MEYKYTTREEWLMAAIALLTTKHFAPNGYNVPDKVKASIGFPKGRGGKKGGSHSIGQCWHDECSKGKIHEIFIHPELDDASRILDVLIHEMVHAVVSVKAGHRKAFRECAVKLGLEGKMTATVATEELKAKLYGWITILGPIPHYALSASADSNAPKKQTSRQLKIACPDCGWTGRCSQKMIDLGLPTCACGQQITEDGATDGGEDD